MRSFNFWVSIIFLGITMSIITSCISSKKIVYFNNISDSANKNITIAQSVFENRIQKNDLLSIIVGGSNNEDVISLNSGIGIIPGSNAGVNIQKGMGYLVESDGKIQFPYLGRIQAEGLTRRELSDTLTRLLDAYTKNPVVNVKFINYKYSVLGEVVRPGEFSMDNERTTIIEALSNAGDVTILGKRDNVLVIREINGEREFGRINLLSADAFKSPYYYLKTNDVIYVEPVRSKFINRSGVPQYVGIAAAGITLLLTILNFTKK